MSSCSSWDPLSVALSLAETVEESLQSEPSRSLSSCRPPGFWSQPTRCFDDFRSHPRTFCPASIRSLSSP